MGPRLNRRGKNSQSVQEQFKNALLQWGHASTGVESGHTVILVDVSGCFNGATPQQAWKVLILLYNTA